jgi:hypothetical protein
MRGFGLLAGARRRETGIKLAARGGLGWRARLSVSYSIAAPLRALTGAQRRREAARRLVGFGVETPGEAGVSASWRRLRIGEIQ